MKKIIKLRETKDTRGSLVESTNKEIIENSKHFFISKSKPGVIRGNHYHKRKFEWFLVIKGKARIVTENINTKKQKEKIISDKDNILIANEPNTAHAIENIGKGEMILFAFVNEVLDHKNPDTFNYKVI